jgi:alkylation response protein AidB-like acyl-CoA dehydrogenase
MSIPLRELEFALFDVPKLDESRTFGGTLLDPDLRETAREVLRTAEKIALTTLAPCAARLDVDEPFIRDGRVVLPDETGHALQQLAEGGFTAMAFAEQDGGLGLPFSLS